MRFRTLAAGLAVMTALLPAGDAEAACRLRFGSLPRMEFVGRYDAFADAGPATRFELTVDTPTGGICDFAVGVDAGTGGAGGGGAGTGGAGTRRMTSGTGALAYALYTTGNGSTHLLDAGGAGIGNLLTGGFRGKPAPVTLPFFADIPAGQIVPAGRYSDTLTFTLYDLEGGIPGAVLDTRSVRVAASVAPVARFEVVIGGVRRPLRGRLGTLDFGELEEGERLGFELEVSGNLDYDVEIESGNGGTLAGRGEAGGSSVPYALRLDGRPLAIGGRVRVPVTAAASSGRDANRHDFDVEIGSVSGAVAGKYRDDLTLTVTAR